MKKRIHYGWIVIFLGMITTVASHGFGRMAYTILLPSMKDGLGFSYTQLGLLGTGKFIGYLSMAVIGGLLAARFGTRVVVALALLLMGFTMICTGFARSFGFAFLMRLLTGMGNGAAFVPIMALGSSWFSINKRGFATGIVSGGIGLGIFLSGIIIPDILSLYENNGWRYSWYILGIIVIFIALLVLIFLRNQPSDIGLDLVGQKEMDHSNQMLSRNKMLPISWNIVYKMKELWNLGIVYFFFGLSYIIYSIFFAAYLVKEMGYTEAWAGGLWATVGILSIFCGVLWGGISDWIGRGKASAVACLVLGISYIVYAILKNEAGFYLSAIIFGLTAWSIPTIMAAAAGDLLGQKLAPAGLGFITLFFGIGQSIGPALGGYLADINNSFTLSFIVAGGISFSGMVFSIFIKPPAQKL